MNKPKIISLCCGAGISEEGSRPFFQTIIAIDNWWRGLCAFMANHHGIRVMRGDVCDKDLISWAKDKFCDIDGVVATPPCVSFSNAGKRDLNDKRAHPFLGVLDWVAAFLPRFVVIENVPGLRKLPHLTIAIHRLRFLGYRPFTWLLDAAEFGTPQHRERLFLIGMREGEAIPELPMPTHGPGLRPYRTIRDAIGDLNETDALAQGCAPLSAKRAEIMSAVPAGGNWRDLSGWRLDAALKSINGRKPPPRLCRRHSWDETAGTLLSGPHCQRTTRPLHPHENRPFSVVEHLRLQGVTRPYLLCGNIKERYAQAGNGVPVELMAAVAGAVAAAISDP